MAGHFDSIGFPADDESALQPFIETALRDGDQIEVIGADPGWGGRYICWSPGKGIQLWVCLDERGKVTNVDPHFAGRGRAHITIERSYDYDTAPPTGGVFAWVALGSQEETKAGFDLPAFARFYDMACDYDGNALIQPAAFAHGAEVFADVEAYYAFQRQLHAEDANLAFAAESFLPIGLFDPNGEMPPATARLSGIVLEAETLTNAVTGRTFHHALVKTVGMTIDVVADADQLSGTPAPGNILAGSFWISALPAEGPRQASLRIGQEAKITISRIEDE